MRLVRDGFRWELQPGFAPVLEALLQDPGVVVKESPAKRVTRHDLGDRTYYVKAYRHEAVPLRPLKFLVARPAPRREWENARRLESLGIPVVRHLAHGERWRLGLRESLLVTEGFAGRPLEEVPGLDPAPALALVEQLHRHGVHHSDLHSGNLLADPATGELRLVDIDKLRFGTGRPGDPGARDEMLAFLNISFPLPLPPAVRALSARRRRELLADRSWRCLRHNREFAPVRAGGLRWQARTPLLSPDAQRVLADPDAFLASAARSLKQGQSTTVGARHGLVLKRFNRRGPLHLLKDLARASRARRGFRKAYHLELAGVPTARVVAAAERRPLGLLLRSYLLMEELPDTVMLRRHLRDGHRPGPALLRALARLVARLHDEGFTHGDLNERNLLLNPAGQVFLIDLDALTHAGVVPGDAAARDLGRLAADMARHPQVTPADLRAFLRAYCRARHLRRVPRSR
jgi:tRNA A-37 threonylcarbamoyl transferase component Bud32